MNRIVSPYWLWTMHAIKTRFAFRIDLLLQIVSTLVDITIRLAIWKVTVGSQVVDGINYADMVAYTLIGSVVQVITWSSPSPLIGAKIRSGDIVYDMIRPISLTMYFTVYTLGRTVGDLIMRVVPSFLLAYLFFGIGNLEISLENLLLFFFYCVMGITLYVLWEVNLSLIGFWSKDIGWVGSLSRALMRLLGGTFVPLWFFPSFLTVIASFTPFPFLYYLPTTVLMGKAENIVSTTLIGIGWVVALSIVLFFMWKRVKKYLSVQGG